jgi:hypothetical protein
MEGGGDSRKRKVKGLAIKKNKKEVFSLLKRTVSVLVCLVLLALPLVSYAATHSFVYDFNKSIRSRDFKFKGYHDLTLTFKSVTCRKNQTMKVEVKHNVSWGRDTTTARKNISECGGTIRHIGFDNKTPVYFIVTKNTKDKFWVQGTGKIHN